MVNAFRNIIIKRLGRITEMPTLFESALEIDRLLQDYNTSIEKIVEVFSLDPALTTKALKIANSAAYASVSKVTDIKKVIARLGFDELRKIVLTVAVLQSFSTKYVDYQKFWMHSICVAFTAVHLHKLINPNKKSGLLFSCGILHDIGVVMLDQHFPELYKKVFEMAAKNKTNLHEVEKKVLGIDSGEVGAMLLEQWGLPKSIVHVIGKCSSPELDDEENYNCKLLYLACFITNNRGIDNGTGFFPEGFNDRIWDELGLSVDSIQGIIEQVDKDVEAAKEIIKLGR